MSDASPLTFRVVVLMPVFEDWECASAVCQALDEQFRKFPRVEARLLLVDDGSPNGANEWIPFKRSALMQLAALRLRRNMGHQRAICVGVCYVYEHVPCDAVLIMDADGEDRVEDAVRLVELAISKPAAVFFAERRKRLEGMIFRIGYSLFRALHRVLTGIPVRVGNFSIVPQRLLGRLTCMPELWNHYAGTIFRSKVSFECIPMDRGERIKGRSHMNLVSLVAHGISGIATFNETVATRILMSNVVGLIVLLIALTTIFGIRLWTPLAIPGWATYTTGLAMILLVQLLGITFSLVFSLISNRTTMSFIPVRDYAVFVEKLENLPELG